MKKIRKKINGYLENITDKEKEIINENAILNKNKLTYIKDEIKHSILFNENEIILMRESKEFKNILTFSKNRSILSEYIIKENNISFYLEVETLDLKYNEKELCIKYMITDSNTIYEYKIIMEE